MAPSKEFEVRSFNDQVLLLDHKFVHRLTGIEGKDGDPSKEVRVLCNSILLNRGNLQGSQGGRTLPALRSSSRRGSPC
jgi:hypothetical protein